MAAAATAAPPQDLAAVTPAAGARADAPATTERHTYARTAPWSGGAAAQLMDVPSVFTPSPDSDTADASGLALSRTAPPPLRCLAAMAVRRAYALRRLPYTLPAVLAGAVELAPLSLETQRAALADNPPSRGELCWGTHWQWAGVMRSLEQLAYAMAAERRGSPTVHMLAAGGAIASLLDGFPVQGQHLRIFLVSVDESRIGGDYAEACNNRAAEWVARWIADTIGYSVALIRDGFAVRLAVPSLSSVSIVFKSVRDVPSVEHFIGSSGWCATTLAWDFTTGRLVTLRTAENAVCVYPPDCVRNGGYNDNRHVIADRGGYDRRRLIHEGGGIVADNGHARRHAVMQSERMTKYRARGYAVHTAICEYTLPTNHVRQALKNERYSHEECCVAEYSSVPLIECPLHNLFNPAPHATLPTSVVGKRDAHLFAEPYLLTGICLYVINPILFAGRDSYNVRKDSVRAYVETGVLSTAVRAQIDHLLAHHLCHSCATVYNHAILRHRTSSAEVTEAEAEAADAAAAAAAAAAPEV